jgi:hypothetical protein
LCGNRGKKRGGYAAPLFAQTPGKPLSSSRREESIISFFKDVISNEVRNLFVTNSRFFDFPDNSENLLKMMGGIWQGKKAAIAGLNMNKKAD